MFLLPNELKHVSQHPADFLARWSDLVRWEEAFGRRTLVRSG